MSVKRIIKKHQQKEKEKAEALAIQHKKELDKSFKDGFVLGTVFGSAVAVLASVIMSDGNDR